MTSEGKVTDVMHEVEDWNEIDPDGTMAGVPAFFSPKRAADWLERQETDQAFVVDDRGKRMGRVRLRDLRGMIEEDWVFVCDRTWNHGGKKQTYPFNPGVRPCNKKPLRWRCWGCGECSMEKKKRQD